MSLNTSKVEMLNIFSLIQDDLNCFKSQLTPQQKQMTGTLEAWSAKDVITHLVFWNNNFIIQVENAKAGERSPQVNDYLDQVNDGVFIEHFDQPFSEAFEDLINSFSKAEEIIDSYSDEELIQVDLFNFLNGHTLLDRFLGTFGFHIPHHISDFYSKNGRLKIAVELQEKYAEILGEFPSWKANAIYNLACFYAQNDLEDKAILALAAALKEKPELIEWSKKDADLDPLREIADYKALYKDL